MEWRFIVQGIIISSGVIAVMAWFILNALKSKETE